MKVKEILEHFLSQTTWIDKKKTVDRVIVGDPDKDVDKCLVTWMPSMQAIQRMVDLQIPMMMCHEPTFWNHHDKFPENDPLAHKKLKMIKENDLVIMRNHDAWDRWPKIGIPFAWAKFLAINGEPVSIGEEGYQHRYDIEPKTLGVFAKQVAERCKNIGEPTVQVVGDLDIKVSKIGIGTGCVCNISTFIEMGCDCSIVCDDGSCYWAGIQWSKEYGHPVIRVNHGTSEEPGMVTLTQYINDNLPGLSAIHLPHGNGFFQIRAE